MISSRPALILGPVLLFPFSLQAQDAERSVAELPALVVSGKAKDVLGKSGSASQGQASREELLERPWLRRGELLETVPGMVVTQHSGDGKANQYFVRGYNLDHGTDFGIFADDMPVNLRTHAHGQGYSDLNFLIPEFIGGIDYGKGPFYPSRGDLTTAGFANFRLVDELPRNFAGITVGENEYYRGVFGQSMALGGGTLTMGGEGVYYNGPWALSEASHRYNGILRWRRGDADNFLTITALGSQGSWRSTDQIPERAIAAGQIDRFGYIDPTDGGRSQRYSLSATMQAREGDRVVRGYAYLGYYDIDLFSNFTYFLDDPVHGDQFHQGEARIFGGGGVAVDYENREFFGAKTTYTVGVQTQNDYINNLVLQHTVDRNTLQTVRQDDVYSGSYSIYGEAKTRWNPWFRTEAGLRGDVLSVHVNSDLAANSGSATDGIVVPKLNLIFGPWEKTEVYVNLGGGFHSNDARGATLHVDPTTGAPAQSLDPLVRTWGAELGTRTQWSEGFNTSLALWWLHNNSELVYAGDVGTVDAGPDTTRIGIEATAYYRLKSWFAFDGEISLAQGRYDDVYLAGGPWVENQVPIVISTGLTIGEAEGFFGSLRGRYFSKRPLDATKSEESRQSIEVNLRGGYRTKDWEFAVDCLNLLDRRDNDIEYEYESQLPGENSPVNDRSIHPTEPRSLRVSVTRYW